MNRRLFFDGQVFQTPAWHRGMGKYSLELIVALNTLNTKLGYWDSIDLILSSQLDTEKSFFKSIEERAPEVRITKLQLERNEYDNRPVASRNRRVIDEFFASQIKQGDFDYIILSLMQSEIAPAFSSLDNVHNYLLFYDLIPLMFHKTYLLDTLHQKSYLSKLAELLNADTFLAISRTVANDLTTMLGIDKNRVLSIDGAPIAHGRIAEHINVPRPFILMPTGNDLRKNNRRGIEGFELFNQKHENKYSLVITSVFQDFEIKELSKLSNNVVFTGNVSGEQLEYLFENTDALLFPTEYEGLGLPILEALEKNKPIACSDISVFREISDTAFEYFNPKEAASISAGLTNAVSKPQLPLKEYKRILNKFTWKRTAELLLETSKSWQPVSSKNIKNKKTLKIFCPSTDESTLGADIQQLHSELIRLSQPAYYMDTYCKKSGNINYLIQSSAVRNISRPTEIEFSSDTLPVYFIEDAPNCGAVLLAALAHPGVLVLKSDNLRKLWRSSVERKLIHETRYKAEEVLGQSLGTEGLLNSLVANQKVVIVHDENIKLKIDSLVAKNNTKVRVILVPPPSAGLVYGELNQDFSILDYVVNVGKNSKNFAFKEYADLLLKEASV